jgi:hypothetical protein
MERVAGGQALVPATLLLLVCDVVGGFLALAWGADSWNEAWGFDTTSTVPLPIGMAQVLLAWLAARDVQPPVGWVAAVLLSVFCLVSALAGLFDGDLIGNVESEGILSPQVLWGAVLLLATVVVGLLAAAQARRLGLRRRTSG